MSGSRYDLSTHQTEPSRRVTDKVRPQAFRRLRVTETEDLMTEGTISEGMIPKLGFCVRAVRGGVPHAHIVNGNKPHTILLELFTDAGVGTMITE